MQAGLHLAPVGLGALITLPIAGVFIDKYGPAKIVLIGLPVMAVGLGIFTWGVARQAHFSPTLLAGLTITGLGVGCTTTPLSAALMQSLAPHQIARGTTLVTVNQQLGGSVGAALMAVVLTNQFTSDETLIAANKVATLQDEASKRGLPVDPSAIPRQALSPDFASHVMHNLSQVYTLVFVLTVALVAFTIVPAAFLPTKPVRPDRQVW
jgi:MFS transporter, DHA2 family, multidrug resistance protein